MEIFENFVQNRDLLQISTKIEIFITKIANFDQKRDFLHISTKIEIFAKFDNNRDFLQISTKNFRNCDQNGDPIFQKTRFRKISTKIEIFDKFRPKSRFFPNFDPNRNFRKFRS